jgi:hypothetical protein
MMNIEETSVFLNQRSLFDITDTPISLLEIAFTSDGSSAFPKTILIQLSFPPRT